MNTKSILFCFLLGFTFIGHSQSDTAKKLLFIGNSLTYTNDLPKLVEVNAKEKGIIIETTVVAYPNVGLEDHWYGGSAQLLIKEGNYDYVIIQQGPSSQEYGSKSLLEFGKKFKKLCDKYHARLAYFMVWPSKKNYYTYDDVIKNYTEAATKNNAILCPVGEVWKAHFEKTNDFSYYGKDGFHPSLQGSQAAAEIIVKSLLLD
tara:strand:+ start:669278 stop:669886 length:609 start_codon:yes stop_codon:yes gene_type:complete